MKYAFFGSGAAGSVFASYLRKGGADVILIDRRADHMNKVGADGMIFTRHLQENGVFYDVNDHLTGFRTYTSASDALAAEGTVDVLIFVTKAHQLKQALVDSAPVVGEDTLVCSLINGLGNDDMLLTTYPPERCLIGSGVLGTALPEVGHCVSTPVAGPQMNFGAIKRTERTDAACAEMQDFFRAGGLEAYWRVDDVYKYIWKKVIVNATVNTVCAVLRLKIGQVNDDPFGRSLFHGVIRESCAVATARGTALDADDFIAHDFEDVVTNVADYYPSMAQDMLFNHKQTEIDVLNGKIADYGEELGIPTPTCTILSQVVRCIQGNYDKQYLK